MSVYLALHTDASPDLGQIAEFGRIALALGVDPKTSLVIHPDNKRQLTVVLPLTDIMEKVTRA